RQLSYHDRQRHVEDDRPVGETAEHAVDDEGDQPDRRTVSRWPISSSSARSTSGVAPASRSTPPTRISPAGLRAWRSGRAPAAACTTSPPPSARPAEDVTRRLK